MRQHPAQTPDLTMVAAHLGSPEHDLAALAEHFEQYPNFNIECAARVRYLTRHPRDRVRQFFIKYQDRILYEVDMSWKTYRSGPPGDAMWQAYILRRKQRYLDDFAYFAGGRPNGLRRAPGRTLALPRDVLEKFYSGNATAWARRRRLSPAPRR